ncbi:MAG: 3-deoxy-D-manno-octulosonic acid transferase [Acidobacteria bacterium]|nr:MAG: 3-deoxy-D-manno-octulosonic acid transferase [Acidobacteriota bacterium]REK03929.1 MAG: 3-deoxy-D-manno-octulosonic acid transferase [Acidobacteriota bacterium]REK15091.1 MAG: 3-deoxy-D-manno-octulosonic acid transferase [Acidobacteriota bacterium]REK46181.1 MAG: 3-deoxy-D-manno-octulosonic acid transferase [Acidobacteriota bacterium]
MFFLYSLLYTIGFLAMLPVFLYRREKYLSGFRERFGFLSEFRKDGRPVVWIHCVSVGEANAAKSLVEAISKRYPEHRIVISTVTKTGQDVARSLFAKQADFIFYFPFDWRFTVRRALRAIRPNIVLILETEIWFNFFRETRIRGITLGIVNGRLSEASSERYRKFPKTMKRVMRYVDFVFAQSVFDAERFRELGVRKKKIKVTGNLKFDRTPEKGDDTKRAFLRERFSISEEEPLILAASTHHPEEEIILQALSEMRGRQGFKRTRLMIAPRHPERFDDVAGSIAAGGFTIARRSEALRLEDSEADVILLDSIGELKSAYPLANLVFVGGSLIPHGGQSIIEPALEKKAIVTGPHLENFAAAARRFEEADAVVRLEETPEYELPGKLASVFEELLRNGSRRIELGENAHRAAVGERGATEKTLDVLDPVFRVQSGQRKRKAAPAG